MACKIERTGKLDDINAMLAAGLGLLTIEKQLRSEGFAIKRETIKRHLDRCLKPSALIVTGGVALPAVSADEVRRRRAEALTARDFATLVQRRAIEALAADHLRVSTRDGLAAQALIDRRAERQKDQEFVLNLTRILSGAGAPPPAGIVEGDSWVSNEVGADEDAE